ncbi:histidine kinase OS=Streptomyces tendae OX=1932 GN=GUR47_33615 PE=4 SV=1 [Streptomyces tendae]
MRESPRSAPSSNIARRVQAIVHQQAERTARDGGGPRAQPRGLRRPPAHRPRHRLLIGRLADSISVIGGGRPGRRVARARRALQRAARRHVPDPGVPAHQPDLDRQGQRQGHRRRTGHPRRRRTPRQRHPLLPARRAKVHVTATEVQTGAVIEIEDAGVSLSEEARARARGHARTAPSAGTDFQDLAEPPAPGPRRRRPALHRSSTWTSPCAPARTAASARSSSCPARCSPTEPGVGLAHGIGATPCPRPNPTP